MLYRVLYVGRQATDPLCEAAAGYEKRLARYVKVSVAALRDHGSTAEQGERLLAALARDPPSTWVALDERGEQPTTAALAAQLEGWHSLGLRQVAFVIGGADGLSVAVREAAPRSLALSRLTLPHRLARLLLAEQLYRAHTLLRGEPYHRA